MSVYLNCPNSKCNSHFPPPEFNHTYWCFYDGDQGEARCPECGAKVWWEMRVGPLDSRGFRKGGRSTHSVRTKKHP